MIRGRVISRQRLCRYCGDLHEVSRWPDNCKEQPPQRSDYPSPFVVSDYLPGGINGLYHHAACKKIDSKAAYRRATKEAGCIEIGNEYDAATKEREFTSMTDHQIESAINDALNEVAMDDGKGDDCVTVTNDVNKGKGVFHGA